MLILFALFLYILQIKKNQPGRFSPVAVAEWVVRLSTDREINRSNPGILPLLS